MRRPGICLGAAVAAHGKIPALIARLRGITLELDRTDIRILSVVQEHGDLTLEELAARALLSPSQCSRRLQTLRERGYISRVVTLLDAGRLGLGLKAYVSVVLRHQGKRSDSFHALVQRSAEVLECCMTAGEADYVLKLCTRDLKTFRAFLDSLADTNQSRGSVPASSSRKPRALPPCLSTRIRRKNPIRAAVAHARDATYRRRRNSIVRAQPPQTVRVGQICLLAQRSISPA